MLRRLAVLLCLALLPSLASAEVIRYVPPPGGVSVGSFSANCITKAATATTLTCALLSDDGTKVTLGSGQILLPNGSAADPAIGWTNDTNYGLYRVGAYTIGITAGGVLTAGWSPGYFAVGTNALLGWGVTGPDVKLYRDAAGILALRNSTNAQTFNWYYSYTDASNYHRGALKTSSSGIEIAAETAGSGADNLDVTLTPAGTGKVVVGGTASPAATDACTQWSVTVDANYIYVCTATGVWKRAALTGGY